MKPRFVLTHGDITGLNIIISSDGIKLVDGDGAMFAPPERDINFLFNNPYFSAGEYLSLTGEKHIDPELREYFGQDWSRNSIIGNFEGVLHDRKSNTDRSERFEEIKRYLGCYR